MGKKRNLPLLSDPESDRPSESTPSRKPSLDAARTRLGGRIRGETLAPHLPTGSVVLLTGSESQRVGLVIFASTTEVHVLLDSTHLLRVPTLAVSPHEGAPPANLANIAADARVFAMLSEGVAVRYSDAEGEWLTGKLVEKCRYGAVVVRDDGTIVAVGFRKLWPLTSTGQA